MSRSLHGLAEPARPRPAAASDRHQGRARERAVRVRDALAALDAICEDTLARAADALPGSALTRPTDSTWLLAAPEAGSRLVLQVAEPSGGDADELLIGTVRVDFLDSDDQSFVANLLCAYGDRPTWRLAKFEHNHIATGRPPLGPRKADARAGLSLQHLDGLLADLARPGIPALVVERTELTAEVLLAELAAEVDAGTD